MFLMILFISMQTTMASTVVAVVDTGADLKHPALKNNLWVNTKEIPGNKIDDDKNGFVDDVHGWNFVNNSNDLTDNHGHGTHIAGIITGESKNAPKVMILKYFDPQAPITGNLMTSVRAIKYALLMGAHIINYSGGGLDPFEPERKVIEEALAQKIPIIAAAGNEGTNADALGFYPASYDLENILSVTAISQKGKRIPSSNWGKSRVHIAAPGEKIRSAFPNDSYAEMTGTSQATAMVTALLAKIREQNPKQDYRYWFRKLKMSSRYNPNLVGQSQTPGTISDQRALYMQDSEESEDSRWLSRPIN